MLRRAVGWAPTAVLLALLAAPTETAGQVVAQRGPEADAAAEPRTAPATVAYAAFTDGRMRIDGLDAEPAWGTAELITDFREYSPEPDADPSQRTEVRVLYSADELYFFVRAYDSAPDSIMRALSRRDTRAPSDEVGVIIDAYNDRRTGFSFYVNPDGVRRDMAISGDGQQDASWDGVWEAATTVDALGWTAELRIPLSQLRYAKQADQVFGFGVRRTIERHSEQLSWPLYSRTTAGLVSQLGQLQGLERLGTARRLEVAPYVVTKNVTRPRAAGGYEHVQQGDIGGDLKLGLGPNITLDATVNPDFGQVEADPAVVNLTAFESFFAERRPFFLEGTGLYRFSLNCYIVNDCHTNEGLFYSRRVGRSPTLGGLYGDATTPAATPIDGAMKLTGRLPGGLSFGLLDAVTGGVRGPESRTVEPRTNYAALRLQQDLRGGDAGVGLIATGVNRSLDEWTRPYLHESAYVAGLDARTRFGQRNYEVRAYVAASTVAGDPAAIERTQRSATHYYQQPDDDLVLDPVRDRLSGYTAQVKVGKYAGGITRFESSYVHQSGGFEPNDLGFLRRADIRDWSTWASLNFQDPSSWYRWAAVNANMWHHWTTSGTRIQSAVNFNGHLGLHNNWNLHAGSTVNRLGSPYCDRCTRGGPRVRQSRGVYPWFGVNGDSRRAVVPGIWANLGYWDEGASHSRSLSPFVELRFSTRLRVSLGSNLYDADVDAQWLGNFEDGTGTTRYAFAHLDQRTVSFNARVAYTATPDLTLELYAEPFVSSGVYTDVREVVAPEAARYADRFAPYTPPDGTPRSFNVRQLRTNAVVRWEYRPGSTLFLVWAHGRDSFATDVERSPWTSDMTGLFDLHADNTFAVKVSYWFGL